MAWPQVSSPDVVDVIPQRHPVGGWTDTTIPTAQQVDGHIVGVANEVQLFIGAVPTAGAQEQLAADTIAVGIAAEIERAVYPEQSAKPGSTYEQLRERYAELKAQLYLAVNGTTPPTEDQPVTVPPSGTFPEAWGIEDMGF